MNEIEKAIKEIATGLRTGHEVNLKISRTSQRLAIQALEKQLPHTPTTNTLVIGVGKCECHAEFLDKDTKYCGNCGKKLDWSN